ncbi:hypothetical protein ACU5AX_03805 [Sphingomonas sp. XXL09]|uniref:hypothetical protein n=1 Tax=Sphingomonas sp. XXL09 TaxID=3457787 RepID=UPI00406BA42D
MLETATLSAFAWLLMAGAAFRHRRDADVRNAREARLLRIVAGAILSVALLRCGTGLTGERFVRMLAGASLGGVAVVLTLSVAAAPALAPARLLLRIVRLPARRRLDASAPFVAAAR